MINPRTYTSYIYLNLEILGNDVIPEVIEEESSELPGTAPTNCFIEYKCYVLTNDVNYMNSNSS